MTITINGVECPLHFGIRAAKSVHEYFASAKESDLVSLEQIVELVWAGIDNAAYRDRKPAPVEFKQVYDEVEAMFFDPEKGKKLTSVFEAYAQSQFVKSMVKTPDEDVKKKKSTGRKSKEKHSES